jgi:hypothetical protein
MLVVRVESTVIVHCCDVRNLGDVINAKKGNRRPLFSRVATPSSLQILFFFPSHLHHVHRFSSRFRFMDSLDSNDC